MVDSPVGGTHPVLPDRGHDQGHYAGRHGAPSPAPEPPPARDEVHVSTGEAAVLEVLRERVLARTRELLGMQAPSGGPEFTHATDASKPAAFLGRLLSDQNLIAAARAGDWPAERIRAAVAEAVSQGAADALEVLQDVGHLDAEAWARIGAVLTEFRRKVGAAMAPPPQ